MAVALPNPSSRLLRAAVAEQDDLVRHRDRLTRERVSLLSDLRQLDDALAAVDRRLAVLAELAGETRPHVATTATNPTPDALPPSDERAGAVVLRGPAIRETAVRVLLAQPEPIEALHYRRWYELLNEAGYSVAGKDPLAVFLTQLSRSPLVRKTSAPGMYAVDRQAPIRIRHRLERLQSELREVTTAPPGPVGLEAVRARRHELDVAISQQERALEESLRVLGGDQDRASAPSAARSA